MLFKWLNWCWIENFTKIFSYLKSDYLVREGKGGERQGWRLWMVFAQFLALCTPIRKELETLEHSLQLVNKETLPGDEGQKAKDSYWPSDIWSLLPEPWTCWRASYPNEHPRVDFGDWRSQSELRTKHSSGLPLFLWVSSEQWQRATKTCFLDGSKIKCFLEILFIKGLFLELTVLQLNNDIPRTIYPCSPLHI